MRRAAEQFEAVLLTQLTSALNKTGSEDGEESLFGSDGGTGLAQQMFSEQLAKTMAESGGVGLADLIMQKFGAGADNKTGAMQKTLAAVRDIKREGADNAPNAPTNAPLINKNARLEPVVNNPAVADSNGAEIVSTFVDEVKSEGLDDALKNLMLDGRIVNSTRPRLVPNQPVNVLAADAPVAGESREVRYQMPVAGRVSSGFGNRFHPIDRIAKFHGGVDIAVPKGTPVASAADGVVTFAGWKKGYGNLVVVSHPDGRETRYAHLDKISVAAGDPVAAGQPIALSGSTGKSTGPHLHFELREKGEVTNPLKFMTNVLTGSADR